MILTTVKAGTEQLRALQKLPCKYTKVTDIVVGTQIVQSIVRLEMHYQHLVDVTIVESDFITVQIICLLLIDGLHIFIKYTGMQQIIMVKQADKLTGCQLVALIGITCNALVLL